MDVLWLITARSGSRTIPEKNLLPLGGHPLLAFRIAAARQLAGPDRVWLSTDSERYAEIGHRYGATVPFIRPPELATDAASSVDVVLHAMRHAAELGRSHDAIGLLEPTSPFVLPVTVKQAVERLDATPEATGIVATRLSHPSTFYIQPEGRFLTELARRMADRPAPRRQDEPAEITPSGGFHIARWQSFLDHPTFYTERTLSYRVSDSEAPDIDEPIDYEWARFLLASGRIDLDALGLPPPGAG